MLKTKPLEDGLLDEMKNCGDWNYNDMLKRDYKKIEGNIKHVKYEELMADYNNMWKEIISFLDIGSSTRVRKLDDKKINNIIMKHNTNIMPDSKIKEINNISYHVSFKFNSENWRKYFTPKVRKEFKRRYPRLITKLGFSQDEMW